MADAETTTAKVKGKGWSVYIDATGRTYLFRGDGARYGYRWLGWTAGTRREGERFLAEIRAERNRVQQGVADILREVQR